MSVTFQAIETAAARLAGQARRTPVLSSRTIDARTGARVFFKCENFQRMGAFKFRGAYNALAQLPDAARRRGVVAYSSGNHAQAVALAGSLLGIPATIVMPADAPEVKLDATRGYGARIVTYDRATQKREDIAAELASRDGLTTIPPFDHPDVIAGQGTAALELLRETGPLDYLLVPCGGGGLLSGSAIAAAGCAPGIRVIGVEPAAGDDVTRSFRSGSLQSVDNPDTIADGARTQSAGKHTFPLILAHVHDMLTVNDDDLLRAMFLLMERMKIVVEPTGVLGIAALLSGKLDAPGKRVGVILSGGNVDLFALAPYLRRGRAAYGA
ncbi:L-threonine dehydratase catabolic TdcB [Pigmentiphaga humi]|uniref:L-threonine dehydratase catabolic TdcB n=1 Tax=Pigmentiphaga humi TaxID=2478468 RepID=A0A3P4B479_9BURK|nr:threo-3-hydroxy-L-aspartate ammonia-lyase [Pigmentiphaga humi]VCU70741.1 L-threonine dehydratase catabolic TdcB [Pigmentiphaga humi]